MYTQESVNDKDGSASEQLAHEHIKHELVDNVRFPQQVIEALARTAEIQELKAGQKLFSTGTVEKSPSLHLLKTGRIRYPGGIWPLIKVRIAVDRRCRWPPSTSGTSPPGSLLHTQHLATHLRRECVCVCVWSPMATCA